MQGREEGTTYPLLAPSFGLSEGGYGAMNLGLKHADVFGTIVSVSGYFAADPAEVVAGNNPWGHDWALMAANSPLLYAGRLGALPDTHILIMDNTVDRPYTGDALRFDRALTRAGIAHPPAPVAARPDARALLGLLARGLPHRAVLRRGARADGAGASHALHLSP